MSTRSSTAFVSEWTGEAMATMYRHCDGYPTGHGAALRQFLAGKRVVNGIGHDDRDGLAFNGMGCLAASVVAHFKRDIGEFYLSEGARQEYHYTVSKGEDGRIRLKVEGHDVLYDGFIEDFDPVNVERLERIALDD